VVVRLLWMDWDRPLWLDEALQVQLSTSGGMWADVAARDLHPPLWTLVSSGWIGLAGWEAVRWPAFLFSAATVPLAARAGRAWGDARTEHAMAAFAALCAPWVLYAGEGRPYALGLFAVCGLLAAARAGRGVATWGAIASLAQYSAWPIAQLVAGWASWTRRDWRPWVTVTAVQVLLLPLLYAQVSGPGAGLAEGALAGAYWPGGNPATFVGGRLAELGGYALAGIRGATAWWLGVVVVLGLGAASRRPDPLVALTLASLAVHALASLLGLHPFGGLRQLLVWTPLLALVVLRAQPWAVLAVAAGWIAQPALPVEDVPGVLAEAGDLPVLAEGSALAATLYGDVEALPWRKGPALVEEVRAAAAGRAVWLLAARGSFEAHDHAVARLGWTVGPVVERDGVRMTCLAPPGTRCAR
jgi:hypothetical protein